VSALAALVGDFFAYWWEEHPTQATAAGIHRYDDRLERFDPASLRSRALRLRGFIEAFERARPGSGGEALDRSLMLGNLKWELLELEQVGSHRSNPARYVELILNALYLMAVREYSPAAERARQAAARLRQVPRLLGEARANLTAASPVFVTTGEAVATSGVALIEQLLPERLGQALADPEERAAWDDAVAQAGAALAEFADWLRDVLMPAASAGFAIGGEAFHARLRLVHGIEDGPDELYAFGLALKAETEAELATLAGELEPGRPWRDVVEAIKDDHPPSDELLASYAREMERARAFVQERGLATIPADEALEITETPAYLRPLIPYAAYQPPAPHEAEQKGVFYVTPPPPERAAQVLRDHSTAAIPVTALHEAYPGHHLQLTRANRAATEPRRIFWTPVFAEGWALYCEELMWEEGFYTEPRQRLLQLNDLLWRACRVVVDIGLHVRGWSFEQAVEYMVGEAGLERSSAVTEVRRYCADPTQPLSYAAGKREILRLREQYRRSRGAAFTLRDFHDQLLSWGTIPPRLVARALRLG
jgi:uncharacterized protein (DUF885 family)